jgi:ATP-dependent RNA helicase SUPV3L1/SUV3
VVESLGVLERSKVAEDVKSLDQPARAVLRKHGVRFGAFHIYVPALLKPGPRALAAELWALKHGGPDTKGLDDVQRLAASGRTSFPADKETPKALYRASGYRVCGERAVRVDILERLADLIRPALAWREGSAQKPPGAIDGRTFTVTQAMTSLTGSSGEDFASILRALGYRMERRPKPPEEPKKPEPAAEATPAAPSEAATAELGSEAAPPVESAASDAAEPLIVPEPHVVAEGVAPDATEPASEAAIEVAVEECMAVEDASEPAMQIAAETAVASTTDAPVASAPVASEAVTSEAVTSEPVTSELAATEAGETQAPEGAGAEATPTPTEPQFIEVWRPGGRSEERRGPRRHGRPPRRAQGEAQATAAPAEPAAAGAEGATASAPAPAEAPGEQRGRRPERRDRERRDDRPERGERPRRDRQERSGRSDRPERSERGERRDRRGDRRPDRGGENRVFATTEKSPRDRTNREPDPDSPFAKLAALKAQLEAGEKEKR